MEFSMFPANFICWDYVEEHEDIKKEYLKKIQSSLSKISEDNEWVCDVSTSFGDSNIPINESIFDDYFIATVIWKYFDKLLENRPYDFKVPKQSFVHNLWYNVYTKGQYQEIHNHSGGLDYIVNGKAYESMFSGIYILDSDEKNKTVFYQPGPLPCTSSLNGVKKFTYDITEGNIIFFPSGLHHYVMPVEKERTTVSFNIISCYK
jgi:hypothetical protein